MAGYKAPNFNERTAAALVAKTRALDQLRAKPAVDPAVVAAQKLAREERDKAAAERSVAKKAAIAEAKAAKLAAKGAALSAPASAAADEKQSAARVLSAAEQ